jgi:capsular polysaccharide biosynthesis protein
MRARLSGPAAPLLGAAAGLLAAAVVTLLQEPTYRADASIVLVRQGQPPGSDPALAAAAAGAAELFDTRVVAAPAVENLGLGESPEELLARIAVEAEGDGSLVRIEVDGPRREDARRIAQEVAEVSTVLFNDRFGPETVASVWEAASAEGDAVSPDPARNLALGALFGALAGWIPLLLGRRRAIRPRVSRPARAQPQAPEAPVLAASMPTPPVPEAPPPSPATGPFVMPAFGEWTIADVERLVAEQGPAFPERREEIELYVDALRAVAGADGRLPGEVDLVIEDVFAELIARSGSARRG